MHFNTLFKGVAVLSSITLVSCLNHTALEILNTFYDAERVFSSSPPDQRNFTALAAILSPDCRFENTKALPYGGVSIGPKEVEQAMADSANYWDLVDVQNPVVFQNDDSDQIVVVSTLHLIVRKTGKELFYPFTQVFSVDLGRGLLTELRPFYWDVQGVNEALGTCPSCVYN
ncbi:hypothetical protein F5884DRAFT_828649 [Xylogone sp. PMI_703]|nr:hypothetical protein F5884DRAFT_828649 [Xylogone sp. PMI_703]